MITFKLNGKTVQGEEGQYILQVAEKYGVDIPTLCHHKALEPAGMCRLCTVELFDGRRSRFVTACNYPIWEGMEVNTDTEAVHAGTQADRRNAAGPLPGGALAAETGQEVRHRKTALRNRRTIPASSAACASACAKRWATAPSASPAAAWR